MVPIYPLLDGEDQTLYACLAMQHRVGYAGFTRLMEAFRSPRLVYQTRGEELKAIHPRFTPETLESIRRGPNRAGWDKIVDRCAKLNVRIVAPGTSDYPEPLLTLNAPPPLLFIQGSWMAQDVLAAAVVGTRNPTAYGRKAAFALSRDLALAGVTVVSGLAVGVDAEAHEGSMEGGGRTLAVIGCGHDIPYPPENQELRERIVHAGAVLSEFPPGAHPKRDHFPRRNRILSALARATVVVEAGIQSGALLTAGHARAQGKTVFALPGSIFSPVSLGTHALLTRGATLATSATDILPTLTGNLSSKPFRAASSGNPSNFPAAISLKSMEISQGEKEPVLELWRGEESCSLDRLVNRAGEKKLWPPARALAALMEALLQLEMRGLIQRLPGPAFRRMAPRQLAMPR